MGSRRNYSGQGTKSTHKSEQFTYTVIGERGFGLVEAKAETTKYFRNLNIGAFVLYVIIYILLTRFVAVVLPQDRFNTEHKQISITSFKSLGSEEAKTK